MKSIAVLAAMQRELESVLELFSSVNPKKIEIHGMPIYVFMYKETELILALSGVGRANTAMNAALIAREFKPSEMINVGTAGGMQHNQKILDIVIPREVVALDVDLTALGCEYGQILGDPRSYFTDIKMQEKLITAAKGLTTVHTGLVGSSETFVCRQELVLEIHRRFYGKVSCVEMEAFSIGVVCSRFEIPFAVIRSLSDVPAKGEGNENDFNAFMGTASKNAAQLLYKYILE
ncbi:MAG: 5'-methylthioadenosine/adenosylhomocysteine nucleosidase [Fibromonadaceae bacterium]|nr:5'-methylthioadenosine/adenosylhomocysteine nucleosidase [Fibromonadaceae bacterium]